MTYPSWCREEAQTQGRTAGPARAGGTPATAGCPRPTAAAGATPSSWATRTGRAAAAASAASLQAKMPSTIMID